MIACFTVRWRWPKHTYKKLISSLVFLHNALSRDASKYMEAKGGLFMKAIYKPAAVLFISLGLGIGLGVSLPTAALAQQYPAPAAYPAPYSDLRGLKIGRASCRERV